MRLARYPLGSAYLELFRTVPARTWKCDWVSFVKHYGRGNQAVLNYLSRYGLWHHSRRSLASRAWLLLVLQQLTDLQRPMKIADLIEVIGRLTLFDKQEDVSPETDPTDRPCCPYCGSLQTTLLAEWPPPGTFR